MLSTDLENYVREKLRNYNQGGIPINVLVDMEHYQNSRLFLQMVNWYDIGLILARQDGSKEIIQGKDIDSKLKDIIVSWKSIRNGMMFIPEFRTLLIFTQDFDKRISDYLLGTRKYPDLKAITAKDWVNLFLRMNVTSIIHKTAMYKQHYLNTGKAKGFSKVEIEYVKDAYLPIYIKADLTLLLPNPTNSETFILNNLEKAAMTIDTLISREIGKYIILSDKVYYGGYKSCVDGAQSFTLYAPKIKLIERGYATPIEFLMHLHKKVEEMDKKKFEELFATSTYINSYSREEVMNDADGWVQA